MIALARIVLRLPADLAGLAVLSLRPRRSVAAENLFLRRELALYQEIGTIRRECLDWLIPLSESHLRSILRSWAGHYNRGRPHMALGPSVQDPPFVVVPPATQPTRHRIGERFGVHARSLLGGLHHEYLLVPALA